MEEKAVILVAEDETLIRLGAVQMLEEAGFAVIATFNAHDAIEVLENRTDVRAVFTDINMPGAWDGLRLAQMIRERWPEIHLIVTSGKRPPDPDNLPPKGRFIRKPYDPAHVIATIRELLNPETPSGPPNQAETAAWVELRLN